jgi:uncharacterized protein (DUF952 family)
MILHICQKDIWDAAQTAGQYEGDTLASQGFIHCSTLDQVIEVGNYLYKGKMSLVLLVINEKDVRQKIQYEDAGNGKLYPHIYGPLNIDAVTDVVDFIPQTDGSFTLPRLVKL